MTGVMSLVSGRGQRIRILGLDLELGEGVCNPSPAPGANLGRLFKAALAGLGPGSTVLDLGTGSGVFALLAGQAGAEVTATDLPGIGFDALLRTAERAGIPAPRLLHGSLFEPVVGERFDRVFFNPPFHFGEPRHPRERAYMGGADGEVVRSFLQSLPNHLTPEGKGLMVMPRSEGKRYADSLERLSVRPVAAQNIPVLGRVELLELSA